MTAESPQPAASPEPAAAETAPPSAQDGAAGQTAGNQQLRIAILVIVAAVVAIGLWLALGRSSKAKPKPQTKGPTITAVAPISLTASQLKARATGSTPFYWIGPKKGYHYEYQRLSNGNIYVRYLPKGVPVRGMPGKVPIIVTFPFPHAYTRLKAGAHGGGVAGPNGSFVWVGADYPKAAYVTWPHVPYEVEVYSPNARKAARIAKSGNVTTVG